MIETASSGVAINCLTDERTCPSLTSQNRYPKVSNTRQFGWVGWSMLIDPLFILLRQRRLVVVSVNVGEK